MGRLSVCRWFLRTAGKTFCSRFCLIFFNSFHSTCLGRKCNFRFPTIAILFFYFWTKTLVPDVCVERPVNTGRDDVELPDARPRSFGAIGPVVYLAPTKMGQRWARCTDESAHGVFWNRKASTWDRTRWGIPWKSSNLITQNVISGLIERLGANRKSYFL